MIRVKMLLGHTLKNTKEDLKGRISFGRHHFKFKATPDTASVTFMQLTVEAIFFRMGKYLALFLFHAIFFSCQKLTCVQTLTPDNILQREMFDFKWNCPSLLEEFFLNKLRSFIYRHPMKFMYPCQDCHIEEFEFADPHPDYEKFWGKLEGETLISNLTFRISKYSGFCNCHMYASESDIAKELEMFDKEKHSNCTDVHISNRKSYKPSEIHKCFHPNKLQSNLKNPMAKIQLSGSNLIINAHMTDTIIPDNETGNRLYDVGTQDIRYHLLYTQVEEYKLPQVICEPDDTGDEYEVITCNCLKNAGYFDVFPTALADHVFKCGGNFQHYVPTDRFPYTTSCHELAQGLVNDYEDELD